MIEFGYGDIYSRPTLDDQARQLAAISALSAMGGAEPQLEYHIGIALNVGVPPGQIVETVLFLSPFVGFARDAECRALDQASLRFAQAALAVCTRGNGFPDPLHQPASRTGGFSADRGRRSPRARRSR